MIRTVLASLWFVLIALANAVLVVQIAAVVRRGGASHAPFDPPRRLVEGGRYRRSRNPMCLLYASTLLGEAIL